MEYTSSKDMVADGLTKALQRPKWAGFLEQLGLVAITDQLDRRKHGFNDGVVEERLALLNDE